ncbi:MAG: arylsulfatase A-like enzyme [Chlamydiales bacterium]|jgi:arylsulfatase A-like enzyme
MAPSSTLGDCRLRAAFLCAALLVSIGPACSPRPDLSAPPNILLVSIDTLRADHLPIYGYERPTAPRLSRLAETGVVFENATAASSWTLPSHLSMLTGLSVSAHGICDDRLWTRQDSEGQPIPAPLRGTFVSERLRDAGYRCAGFYSWKYLDDQFGFGPGFETWERLGHTFYSHPVVAPEFERLRKAGDQDGMRALAKRYPELFDDSAPSSPEVIERTLDWLRQHETGASDVPFFLFVHLFDVHDPYVPPEPFRDLFDPEYDGPITGRRITAPDSPMRGDMDARDLEHLIALYDGEIAWVDSEIGRLLDGLEQLDLDRSTLTVITSDHGEEFFEHGHKTHRRQVHRESVHVPMILNWPGVLPRSVRVPHPVGLIDIAPTLCSAAGLDSTTGMEGTDLLRLAMGEQPDGDLTRVSELLVFDPRTGPAPEQHLGLAFGSEYALRVIEPDGQVQWTAFDLAQEPLGRGPGRQLDAEGPEVRGLEQRVERLRKHLTHLRVGLAERGEELPPLTEDDLRQLAAMGYAGQDEAQTGASQGTHLCIDGCVWRY